MTLDNVYTPQYSKTPTLERYIQLELLTFATCHVGGNTQTEIKRRKTRTMNCSNVTIYKKIHINTNDAYIYSFNVLT